jgi:hypothetical protein
MSTQPLSSWNCTKQLTVESQFNRIVERLTQLCEKYMIVKHYTATFRNALFNSLSFEGKDMCRFATLFALVSYFINCGTCVYFFSYFKAQSELHVERVVRAVVSD